MSFIKEFLEFLKIRKKYWLFSIIFCFSFIWRINYFKSRISISTIHLYNFLIVENILIFVEDLSELNFTVQDIDKKIGWIYDINIRNFCILS